MVATPNHQSDEDPARVLVVDDDPTVRLLVRRALARAGFAVYEADDGEGGLEVFQRERPDLVLLDVKLPAMDGFSVFAALKETELGARTPVVMMTGLDDVGAIKRAYALGAADFLTKPVNGLILSHRLRFILRAKEAERRIVHLAYYDGLTELPNRSFVFEYLSLCLAHARRHGRSLAVVAVDLDRFKRINDNFGHSAGDAVLKEVARRLKSTLRDSDLVGRKLVAFGEPAAVTPESDAVTRLGGDEFLIVLNEVGDADNVGRIAGRLLEQLSAPVTVWEHDIYLTISLGVAVFPEHGTDVETLARHADLALYRAKHSGRDNYQFFTESLNRRARRRLSIETELRQALAQSEFELEYQPKIEFGTRRVTGTEALLRWRHPQRGLLPPDEFITLAEDVGLIVPIGEWVLRTACAQTRAWQRQGLGPLRVAVNISAKQVQRGGLPDTVTRVLAETGLDPSDLELEITEAMLIEDTETAARQLRRLRELGVRIELDDFGTGFSSLSYLRRFGIDKLKIDGSFIRDVETDSESAAIVTAIAAMARSLNIEVVAEGVETAGQLDFVGDLGCQEIQGYFFSRPRPPKVLARWLRDRSADGPTAIDTSGRRDADRA